MSYPSHHRISSIVALALAATMALAGCGSDDTGSDPDDASISSTPRASSGQPQVSEEFRQCLEEQGVELPSEAPADGTTPSIDPGMQAALQACASLAPEDLASGAPGGEVDQSALDAFADCMDDNGIDVDASLEAITTLDQSKPRVSKALEVCGALIQPSP